MFYGPSARNKEIWLIDLIDWFSYAGPVVWNNLPVDILAEPDITRFKNILKKYLF